jgi:hypothetical protein
VPTLVLQVASILPELPLAFGRYLCEHIPDARLVVVPGHDSVIYGDASEEIAGQIEEFVTGSKPVVEADLVLATIRRTGAHGPALLPAIPSMLQGGSVHLEVATLR